ncbi:hypothetical protein BH09SUM1_BH09SUM1_32470 [soil metagenome]
MPKQLYLIHGNNETDVSNARFDLVNKLLTAEERDSGLTEIRGPGNQPLSLDRASSEIIGELGTASFIPGAKRVVVVYDLKELFGSKGGPKPKAKAKTTAPAKLKVDRTGAFLEWMKDILPTTENVAIFVCQENEEKFKAVSQESALFQFIQRNGVVIEKKEKPIQYEFEDHVYSGNVAGAVTLLREWIKRTGSDSGGRGKIYSTLSGIVETALQARCVQDAKRDGVPENQVIVQEGFPTLGRMPPFKVKKVHAFAQKMTMETVLGLVRETARLQAIMYPTGEEDYIRPWEDQIEVLLLRMMAARR